MKIRKSGAGLTSIRHRRSGFTLVELMVVISIISILSVVGIAVYSGTQSKARDSIRKNDLNKLATALELYNQTTGRYVTGIATGVGGNSDDLYANTYMKNFMNQSMPVDPQSNSKYYYTSNPEGQTYTLCTNLENLSDPDKNKLCYGYSPGFNYGVVPK